MNDMNKGYHGYSMSKRAYEAYENGEAPKSKWTKAAMLQMIQDYLDDNDIECGIDFTQFKKDELFHHFFHVTSWHHCSKLCNEVDFYGLWDYAVDLALKYTPSYPHESATREDYERRMEKAYANHRIA